MSLLFAATAESFISPLFLLSLKKNTHILFECATDSFGVVTIIVAIVLLHANDTVKVMKTIWLFCVRNRRAKNPFVSVENRFKMVTSCLSHRNQLVKLWLGFFGEEKKANRCEKWERSNREAVFSRFHMIFRLNSSIKNKTWALQKNQL